jgi:hypothetical protein
MVFGNPTEGTRTLSVSSDGCFRKVRLGKIAEFGMCGGLFAHYLLNATENLSRNTSLVWSGNLLRRGASGSFSHLFFNTSFFIPPFFL